MKQYTNLLNNLNKDYNIQTIKMDKIYNYSKNFIQFKLRFGSEFGLE